MSENGEIDTAGKNFTLPPAVTAVTNLTSALCLTCVGRGLARWSQFNNLLLLQVISNGLSVCSCICNSFTKTFLCVSILFYWSSFFSDCSLHTSSLSDMQPKHRFRNYFIFCSRFFPRWISFQCSIDSYYSSIPHRRHQLRLCLPVPVPHIWVSFCRAGKMAV